MIYGVEFQTSTTGDHHGNFERHRNCNFDRGGIGYRSAPLFRCPYQMTKDEALKLALEALENLFGIPDKWTGEGGGDVAVWRLGGSYRAQQAITAIKEALAQPEPDYKALWQQMCEQCDELDKKLAQLKPAAWKLVPIEPTNEMLKAMDECSTEGYDERLYAGHAASVYMAAVDVAPTPPQQTWTDLTNDEIKELASWWPSYDQMPALMVLAKDIQNSLKDKNAGR